MRLDAIFGTLGDARDFALESGERLSLRFGAGAGSDDENEWLDRLSRLLPPDARVLISRRAVSLVGDVLIFDVLGGNFRLMTRVKYNLRRIYVKALLNHREYDRKEWMKWA